MHNGAQRKMEYAILLARPEELSFADESFSRIYFGNEFCQELIPSAKMLGQVLKRTSHLDFTLATPYVTNEGLRRLETLFERLSEEAEGIEVVFNDWGVFRLLTSKYPRLEPVMGRLLNKAVRDPRIATVLSRLPEEDVRYFKASNLELEHFREFLSAGGIRRVEFDNLLQGFDLKFAGIDLSLYLPFAYVTTTRYCLANGCDDPEKRGVVGIFPCKRECQAHTFYLEHEALPLTLIRKGNTIFFQNETLPENIGRFSRMVIEPKIPM